MPRARSYRAGCHALAGERDPVLGLVVGDVVGWFPPSVTSDIQRNQGLAHHSSSIFLTRKTSTNEGGQDECADDEKHFYSGLKHDLLAALA